VLSNLKCQRLPKDPKGIEVASAAIDAVQAILLEEISLAKPDDLAFLESQVPRIARRIAGVLSKASP
jgi:hypothetical protein